ncbi:MAG: crossover junction endodeoxyribonuclease RuvC [Patescibacteria group bacterium]
MGSTSEVGRRILGIDPGFGRMGYAVLEEVGREQFTIRAYGCVETKKEQLFSQRLVEIADACEKLLAEFQPESMAIEQLFFGKNVTTGIQVSHARGVIMLTAARAGIAIREFNPLQIKQIITGYGGAKKDQMQRMVQVLLRLKEMPKSDDAADAIAVALCGFLSRV